MESDPNQLDAEDAIDDDAVNVINQEEGRDKRV
jgi:hypothetical protein